MKKILFFAAITLSLMVVSCGNQKKALINVHGKSVALDPCEELAAQAPTTRAYGVGSHFKEANAKNIAELQARAEFARKVEVSVITATEEVGVSLEQYVADSFSKSVKEQSDETNTMAKSIAQQTVKNTNIIKISKYYNEATKSFTIYVCLEFNGNENALAAAVENYVKNKISAEEREKIEKRHDEFQQSILNSLKN